MSKNELTPAQKEANSILNRFDRIASVIQSKFAQMGLEQPEAKEMVNALDAVSDKIEISAFGKESFERRRAEVIQKETDEPYMNTFKNPMAPVQTESDEPYMRAYSDDQSSAVIHGKAENGRALAPGHT